MSEATRPGTDMYLNQSSQLTDTVLKPTLFSFPLRMARPNGEELALSFLLAYRSGFRIGTWQAPSKQGEGIVEHFVVWGKQKRPTGYNSVGVR
jgi:hypothetical protein